MSGILRLVVGRGRARVTVVAGTAAVLLGAPISSAQTPEPSAETAVSVVSEPVPIALADVAVRADELDANLRRIEQLLERRDDVGLITAGMEAAGSDIVELRRVLDALSSDGVSMRILEDHRVDWLDIDERLAEWAEIAQGRWQSLTRERSELQAVEAIWGVTRASAVSQRAPDEIVGRIDGQLARIETIAIRLRGREQEVAGFMDRLVTSRAICAEALDRLSEIEAHARATLLTRDASPIWDGSPPGARDVASDASSARDYWWSTLRAYVGSRQLRFLFIGVGFVLFLTLALLARRWSATWPEDDASLDRSRFVSSRPWSLAIAFALVTTIFVFDQLVGPVSDVIEILALVPVLRLGSGLLSGPAQPALHWATGLLVANRLWMLPPDGSFVGRLFLLVVTVAALFGASRLLRRWKTAPEANTGFVWALARIGTRVAAVLLAISIAANLLGWLNLAEALTRAVTQSAFAGLGWAVVALSAAALGPALLKTRLPRLLPSVERHRASFARGGYFIVCSMALWRWLATTLRQFQVREPAERWTRSVLDASVSLGDLDLSVGRVVAALIVLLSTWLVARAVRFVLREEILPRVNVPDGTGHSVVSVVHYLIWGTGLLSSAAAAGLNTTQLTVVFGALGVGIGFGLQNVVGNFVSGLILIFERPIKVGDRVQTSEHFGVVTGIGIRASTIRKFDGSEVVVPNSDLVAKELVNWTRSDMTRRVEVNIRAALGSDPRQVLEILRAAAQAHPKALAEPAPSAFMAGFGESSLDFRLFLWTSVDDFLTVSSDLHVQINEELSKAGIRIPVPERELRVHGSGAERALDPTPLGAATERPES